MGRVKDDLARIFVMHAPRCGTDHEWIATNGLGYTREMSGYTDILARGYPRPVDPRTVLPELRSVHCPPVLWGAKGHWGLGVEFVARAAFLERLDQAGVTGFETCPVEIVKVATLGRRKPRGTGEPEDQILKAKNVIERVRAELPALTGVIVTGRLEINPRTSAQTRSRRIEPYDFALEPTTDLFHASRDGSVYGGHLFCTARVVQLFDPAADNVAFTPFVEWAATTWPEA
jgi:hypothetical protein